MIGGLFKSASRLALVAVAGVMVGGVSANAADLGGDCCADLEERVAELEATTVRKGNRKVSLTLSGQVHKTIMFWDDGFERNTYAGVDNINSSTRFRFTGEAKIDPKWSAGYLLEIEAFGNINSSVTNQNDVAAQVSAGNLTGNTAVNLRHSAWWIDNKDFGRLWVGQTDAAAVGLDSINLANTNNVANPKYGLNGGGFLLRGQNGTPLNPGATTTVASARSWANISGGNNGLINLSDETRNNVIKYVSPTMMGFIFSAAWGEDDMWDVALRYAGEVAGFKLAAGVGYTKVTDASPTPVGGASAHFNGCADLGNLLVEFGRDRECSSWVAGGSIMHVATGLFVSGSYGERQDDRRRDLFNLIVADQAASRVDTTDVFWRVVGGIEKNWFGLGNTTLYGEFAQFSGTPLVNGTNTTVDAGLHAALAATQNIITNSEVTVWGLGFVQSVDAAAMDIYVGYRNFSADIISSNAASTNVGKVDGVKDYQVINVGGIIRF